MTAPGLFVVIFRARLKQWDEHYAATAARMRELALREFGCLAFHAVTEGAEEVALSYWPDEDRIRAWRAHPEHVEAQRRGRDRWYASYSVEVARVERAYSQPTAPAFSSTPPRQQTESANLLPVRLSPGDDLRRTLEAIVAREAPDGAFVLCGMGSLGAPHLRLAAETDAVVLPGPHELLTLCGTVAGGAAHLHATVANGQGVVVGGHVVEGNTVRTTVEVLLQPVPGWRLAREQDPATGYRELSVQRVGPPGLDDATPPFPSP